MKLRFSIALLASLCVAAGAWQVHVRSSTATRSSLAAYVPQDALLSIQSPDFAGLLQRWSKSPQSKTWLASDSYADFENSRLFGRLGDAQTSFETAAGIPAGVDLLQEVAGKESVFAWYDIGKLEFLYITRMPAAKANRSQLLQSRGNFKRRHAGNTDFYIKTSASDYSTVAFAQVSDPSGDLLILATREDLIANALKLIAGHADTAPVKAEPWFQDAEAALPEENSPPALHMVLNLDRIAHDPHFQSYWIQGNVTWTRQFRAAAADLYLESDRFREERALLPKAPMPESPGASSVGALAGLAPEAAGVFRVVATQDPNVATTVIEEKLLGASAGAAPAMKRAPDPSLDAPQAGAANDLEVRIDASPPIPASASSEPLTNAMKQANFDAVMTLSSAQMPAESAGVWVPIHSAVVVHATGTWDAQTLALALQEALRGSLTTASIGIGFKTEQILGNTVYALDGPRPLFFVVSSGTARGSLVLLADQRELLQQLLEKLVSPLPDKQDPATLIAAFNHQSQRGPYRRLVTLLDGKQPKATSDTSSDANTSSDSDSPDASAQPAPPFFSGDILSLSDTFSDLQTERIVERATPTSLRQTVVYTW
jgi:hypothetical protein